MRSSIHIEPEVVDDLTVSLLRDKTPAQLTAMTSALFAATRDRLRNYLKQLHPTWPDEQVRLELLERIHGTKRTS